MLFFYRSPSNYKGHKRLSNRFMTIAFIYEKIWFTNLTARARLRRNENIKKIFRKNFYGVKIVNPQRVGRKLYHRKAFVDCRKISFAPVILLCSSLSDTLCVVSDYKASLLCALQLVISGFVWVFGTDKPQFASLIGIRSKNFQDSPRQRLPASTPRKGE